MKTCIKCEKHKKNTEFSFRNKGENKRHNICKDCFRANNREHYADNRKKYIDKARQRQGTVKEANRDKILEYLLQHPCVDCGESDPIVLEFDHVRGKKHKMLTDMIHQSANWKSIKLELQKCDVRCSNCHKRKTAIERGYWKVKRLARQGR